MSQVPLAKLEITDNGKEFDDDVVTNEGLDHMCSTKCIAYALLYNTSYCPADV